MFENRGASPKTCPRRTDYPGVSAVASAQLPPTQRMPKNPVGEAGNKGVWRHLEPGFAGLQEKERPKEILTGGATASFHSAASQDAPLCPAHQIIESGHSLCQGHRWD